jgi:hypothetical protein
MKISTTICSVAEYLYKTYSPSSASWPRALIALNMYKGAHRARAPVTKATQVKPSVDNTKLFL